MRIVFTYFPLRLRDITLLYLRYSIKKLNAMGIVPVLYGEDPLLGEGFIYEHRSSEVPSKYRKDAFWQYAKIQTLSQISEPFCHLDNDLIVKDWNKIKIEPKVLNLAYRHPVLPSVQPHMEKIFERYSDQKMNFSVLNNTCIIACEDYKKVNSSSLEILNIFEREFDFFSQRYENIPPTTLNQQYLNLHFSNINYLFGGNPEIEDLEENGVAHLADKNLPKEILEYLFGVQKIL